MLGRLGTRVSPVCPTAVADRLVSIIVVHSKPDTVTRRPGQVAATASHADDGVRGTPGTGPFTKTRIHLQELLNGADVRLPRGGGLTADAALDR